jgi:hypothetical protein
MRTMRIELLRIKAPMAHHLLVVFNLPPDSTRLSSNMAYLTENDSF